MLSNKLSPCRAVGLQLSETLTFTNPLARLWDPFLQTRCSPTSIVEHLAFRRPRLSGTVITKSAAWSTYKHLTVLDKMGIPAEQLGNSTGEVAVLSDV